MLVGQARRPRRRRAAHRRPDGWHGGRLRPGREHDTTALRADAGALPLLAEWTDEAHAVPADLGYGQERGALTTPIEHGCRPKAQQSPRYGGKARWVVLVDVGLGAGMDLLETLRPVLHFGG